MNRGELSFWFTSKGLVALCAIAIIGYFLLVEHRQHLVQWLPYLILLLCPLMHLFMHRGHGHGHQHQSHQDHSDSSDDFKRGYESALREREEHDDKPER